MKRHLLGLALGALVGSFVLGGSVEAGHDALASGQAPVYAQAQAPVYAQAQAPVYAPAVDACVATPKSCGLNLHGLKSQGQKLGHGLKGLGHGLQGFGHNLKGHGQKLGHGLKGLGCKTATPTCATAPVGEVVYEAPVYAAPQAVASPQVFGTGQN